MLILEVGTHTVGTLLYCRLGVFKSVVIIRNPLNILLNFKLLWTNFKVAIYVDEYYYFLKAYTLFKSSIIL